MVLASTAAGLCCKTWGLACLAEFGKRQSINMNGAFCCPPREAARGSSRLAEWTVAKFCGLALRARLVTIISAEFVPVRRNE
eukprot:8178738-Lingulodinium_polyedra.AAC.1